MLYTRRVAACWPSLRKCGEPTTPRLVWCYIGALYGRRDVSVSCHRYGLRAATRTSGISIFGVAMWERPCGRVPFLILMAAYYKWTIRAVGSQIRFSHLPMPASIRYVLKIFFTKAFPDILAKAITFFVAPTPSRAAARRGLWHTCITRITGYF